MKQCENEHALLNSCQTHSAHHCSPSFHLSEQENGRVKIGMAPCQERSGQKLMIYSDTSDVNGSI